MIDLKKFKKVASDKHTTTLRHADGHEFKVVHSVLSPKLKKDIEKIPMSEGGEVNKKLAEKSSEWQPDVGRGTIVDLESGKSRPLRPSEASPNLTTDRHIEVPEVQPESILNKGGKIPHYADGSGDVRRMEDNQVIPSQPEYGLAVEQSPTGESSGGDYGMFGVPTMTQTSAPVAASGQPPQQPVSLSQRVDQAVSPQPQMAAQLAQSYQGNIDQNQAIAQAFQQNKAHIDSEHAALSHDILNGHIDMSNYWKANDKGAAALGALLGGSGAGLTHIASPVPGMIANSQENFLRAEQANLDNPKSLLSAVQAQYGNNKDAMDMMRIISNEALGAHLNKVMTPLNSATAQANGAQVQLSLLQNTEQLKQQMAMRHALLSGDNSEGQQDDPSRRLLLLKQTGMIDEKQYDQANKELGVAQKTAAAHQAADSVIDESQRLQTVGSRLGSPIQSKQKLAAQQAQLIPLILESSPSKRLTTETLKSEIDPFQVGFTTGKHTAEDFRQGLHSVIDTHADQTPVLDGLRSFGVTKPSYSPMSRVTPQQQQALQWLQANPNDPMVPAVMNTLRNQGVPLK